MQVSLKALEGMETRAKSALARAKRVKEESADAIMNVVGSVETFGTAFSMGVINGRWGNPELLGIPVDLGLGLAAHTIGFVLDDGSQHLHRMGDGALSSYFSALGVGVGRKMLDEVQAAARKLAAAP
jgi:hypothetical protein